uniref:Uncharacterized protein n=1 Tax=Arundo donax TaxID=35708 RepID=A0A0A9PQ12_ARUDO
MSTWHTFSCEFLLPILDSCFHLETSLIQNTVRSQSFSQIETIKIHILFSAD